MDKFKIIEIDNVCSDTSSVEDFSHSDLSVLDNIISYNSFFRNQLLPNNPCIIKNISSSWDCTKNWVSNDSINFDYIINEYGNLQAPVADCDTLLYNAHCKQNMKVKEYMNYIKTLKFNKLYLKDWHLKRLKPNDKFYLVPEIFASDWLNEYALDNGEDDFMFVYIGPSGSW